jgi:hypothetical protein
MNAADFAVRLTWQRDTIALCWARVVLLDIDQYSTYVLFVKSGFIEDAFQQSRFVVMTEDRSHRQNDKTRR